MDTYLISLNLDQFLGAVHNIEVLVIVVVGHITSVQPTVRVNCLMSGFLIVKISQHHLTSQPGQRIVTYSINPCISYNCRDCILGRKMMSARTELTPSLEMYTGCPRGNGQNFWRMFLMLKYTDITQNTCVQS